MYGKREWQIVETLLCISKKRDANRESDGPSEWAQAFIKNTVQILKTTGK